jgi:sugar (glycoside-pentoside-hexuronide) transporter
MKDDIGKIYIPKKEKWSFAIAGLGQNMAYGIMSSFLLSFYTDIVFSDALWVVSVIMIAARVWDAINDPIMGSIVDRTRTKWGKCRPYLLAAPFPIAIFTILIFIAPDASLPMRIAYASFTYIMWGMLYTMSDVPFWGLPSAMTPNPKERADFLSFARVLNGFGAAAPFIVMELFKGESGYTKESYLYSAICMAIIGAALFSIAFFTCKERIAPPVEPLKIKENFALVKQNKPLLLILGLGVLSFGKYIVNMCLVYATRDIFYNSPEKISMLLMSAAIAVGMFPGMLIMPKLFRKFNYKQIAILAGTGSFIFQIMFFIAVIASRYNYYVALPFLFFSGIPFGMYNVLTFAVIGDSVDYLEWKTGKRTEGIGFAFQTFMNKIGAAISTGLIPVLLIIIGYVAPDKRPEGYDVPSLGLLIIFALVPAVSMLLSTIPMYYYDFIGEKKDKIMAELNEIRKKENRIIEV